MSKAIEQFYAERDAELQAISEHYSRLQDKFFRDQDKFIKETEEVKGKAAKRIIEFYRAHPDEIGDILAMVQEEVPRLLVTASFEAKAKPTPEEREESFSDASLEALLRSALGAYLDLLKETNPSLFQQAEDLIESSVKDKENVVAQWEKQPGFSPKREALNVITRRAKEAVFGITKVENLAFDPTGNECFYNDPYPVNIWVGSLKKQKVETIASIDFNEMRKLGVTISNEQRLTPYDRAIHNAVSTLCAAGNEYINPQMIFQVLSGNTTQRKDMSSETRKKILESIDKMMMTIIDIDASAEVKAGWNETPKYRGPLVPAERIEFAKLNGQEVADCIHLFRNPPLYDYANNKNQIDRVDIKMLNAPMSNTTENIELKDYLLRQIASMKNPNSKIKALIRYDTLYDYLRVNAASEDRLKHKKKEIRSKTKKFLDFWVKEGFIMGYAEEKEGKTIAKIRIQI